MSDYKVCPGEKIGRWTVLEDVEKTKRGEIRRLCRCDCGTERYVLERSLKCGGSMSCGCLRKEAAAEAISHSLAGQRFGQLTVLERAQKDGHKAGVWWSCRCDCGNTCIVQGSLLFTGRKTHCGCKTERNQPFTDITGQRFNRLVALHPTKDRDAKGSVMWHCRCDCGNEIDASYNELRYGHRQSCGCYRKELDMALNGHLKHVDGTSLEMIQSRKLPKNNTSGARGVYFVRGRFLAKIVFQKKAYYLGSYEELEDAVKAREAAEEAVFDAAKHFYEAWQERAEADPGWAESNPPGFRVGRGADGTLHLECTPRLN